MAANASHGVIEHLGRSNRRAVRPPILHSPPPPSPPPPPLPQGPAQEISSCLKFAHAGLDISFLSTFRCAIPNHSERANFPSRLWFLRWFHFSTSFIVCQTRGLIAPACILWPSDRNVLQDVIQS